MCFVRQKLPARHILLGSPFFSLSFASPKQHLLHSISLSTGGTCGGKHGELQHNTHTHSLRLSSLHCSKGKDGRVQESYVPRGPGRSSTEGIPKEKPPPVLTVGARFPAGAQSKEFLFLLIVKQSKTHACGTPLLGWELGSLLSTELGLLVPLPAVLSSPRALLSPAALWMDGQPAGTAATTLTSPLAS